MTSTGATDLGAVGHGGDRLGASDPVDLVHPGEARRRQHLGRDAAVGRGRNAKRDEPTPATRAGMAHMSTLEG